MRASVTSPPRFNYPKKKVEIITLDNVMSRSKVNYPTTVLLLVEGLDDHHALIGIINEKTCDVKYTGNGKEGVFNYLIKINEFNKGSIAGLVDSDYEKILKDDGVPLPPPSFIRMHLFYTDSHDMNTMVVSSKAFFRMLKTRYPEKSFDTTTIEKIRENAVSIAQQIGLLRCLSAHKKYRKCRFNFREDVRLDPPHTLQYINIKEKKADIDRLIEKVGKGIKPEKKKEIRNFISEKYLDELRCRYPKDDLNWQLCQGHDLFYILFTLLHNECCPDLKFDEFSSMLFDQFQFEDFIESGKNLLQSIKGWERKAAKAGKQYRILAA
jgi:hypothetical protein